jgi:hypothetical protein
MGAEDRINMMKYNIDHIEDTEIFDIHNEEFNFHSEIEYEVTKFENACYEAYKRFRSHKDNAKAELEFHTEIKKYRKVFNHNVQDITRREKFKAIKRLTGRIKEYQIN